MAKPIERVWLWRISALLIFLIAQLLVLVAPQNLQEPDDWVFRYAADNFSQGHITISDDAYIAQSQEVWAEGGQLLKYSKIGERWALTIAPGYVFYLTPFQAIGAAGLGNTLLSLGLAATLYLLLARLRDEKTALVGVVLLLFTPTYLAMWQRPYMDALASLAVPGIGGGLYIYYWLRRRELKPRAAGMLLSAAVMLIMLGVMTRYTNGVIAAVFAIHFAVMAVRTYLAGDRGLALRETLFFAAGALVGLMPLLWYQAAVFGSPFSFGYSYSQLQANFAWQYGDLHSVYLIVARNILSLWAPLLLGFPLLIAAVPALAASGWRKALPLKNRGADGWPGIDGHLWWLLAGWVAALFAFYLNYEWTSNQSTAQIPFPIYTRLYLPMLMPLVIMAALGLMRTSRRVVASALVTLAVVGSLLFMQAVRIFVQYSGGTTPPVLSAPVMEPETGVEVAGL